MAWIFAGFAFLLLAAGFSYGLVNLYYILTNLSFDDGCIEYPSYSDYVYTFIMILIILFIFGSIFS